MRRNLRWAAIAILPVALAGCTPTAEQQAAPFEQSAATFEARSYQSRRFDTGNQGFILEAAVGTLQDMGFTIDEVQRQVGLIVASKLAAQRVRIEISFHQTSSRSGTIVRAAFQEISTAPGAMLAHGAIMHDPSLYQEFFERMSQSAFLTANHV
jgi:hypothetical protein